MKRWHALGRWYGQFPAVIAVIQREQATEFARKSEYTMAGYNPLLSCREALGLLSDDLERQLPAGQNLQMRLHLFLCKTCRDYRRTFNTTVDLARSLREASGLPEDAALTDTTVIRILRNVPENSER